MNEGHHVPIHMIFSFDGQSRVALSALTTAITGLTGAATKLSQEIHAMSDTALAGLTAQVAANTTVIESALVLINGFKSELAAAIAADEADGPALEALTASLSAETQKLAAAVAQNTPAAPAAPAPVDTTTTATADPSLPLPPASAA